MNAADDKQFAQAMVLNGEAFDAEVSRARITLYFNDLKHYDIDVVVEAFRQHRLDPDRGRWFPKIADIVAQIDGTFADRGEMEWLSVIGKLHMGGAAKGCFNDRTNVVVVEMGGWDRLSRTNNFDLSHLRRGFVAAYVRQLKYNASPPPQLEADEELAELL